MKVFYSALFLVLLHGIAHAQCENFLLTVSGLQPPSCPNSSDGAITLSVAGAQGVVSYSWPEAGLSGPSASGLAPGTYSVTATDDAGCEVVETVVLEAALVADAGPDIPAYCGQDTVTIGWVANTEIYFSGDITSIEFSNSDQDVVPFNGIRGEAGTNPNPAGFDPGSGGLFVEIGSAVAEAGDRVCLPVRVYNYADIVGAAFTINYDTGYLGFRNIMGLNPFVPGFSEAAHVSTPNTGLNAGFITVNYFNNDLTGVSLPDGSILFTLCFDVLDIPAPHSASSTGPGYAHQWTGPNNFSSSELFPSVAQPGIYTLRVTDTSQPDCWAEDEVEVRFLPDSIGVELQDVAPSCLDQPITLRPAISGGSGPYAYQWNNGATSDSIFLSSSGTAAVFAVTVTSAEGCTGLASAHVAPASTPPPVADIFLQQPFLCAGESVTLSANGMGGQLPYTYIWRDGPTTSNHNRQVSPSATTTYFLDVIDANGCLSVNGTDSITIVVNPTPSVDLGPDHYLCIPEQVILSGPPGAATYTWSDGQANQAAIVQPPQTATYYLTVTNSFGCTATDTVMVFIGLQDIDISSIACSDNGTPANPDDDSFTFQATIGGSPGGNWVSNLGPAGSYGTTATFGPYPISAGDVTLMVADALDPSCNTTTSVPPPAPCPVAPACSITAIVTNIICADNGTPSNPVDDTLLATLLVDGGPGAGWSSNHADGAGTYSNPDTLAFALAGGEFSLMVFDQDDPACNTTLLIDPAAICAPPCDIQAVVQEIICNDNGTPVDTTDDTFLLEILVSGGPGGSWAEDSSGLSGDYGLPFTFGPYPADYGHIGLIFRDVDYPACVDVFDLFTPLPCAIGCQDNPMSIFIDIAGNRCAGDLDGVAAANVTGGAGSYAYEWSNGSTAPLLSNLPGGEYFLTVTDLFSCTAMDSATVPEPPPLALDIQATPVACPGGNDGIINLFVAGGVPPYTYQWSVIGATGAVLAGLETGAYSVTVFDANNCSITGDVVVTEAGTGLAVLVEIVQQPSCPSSNDGILSVDASGGVPPYEYAWSTGFAGPAQPGLSPGLYSFTVSDANGCSVAESILLEAILTAEAGPDQILDCGSPTVALDGSLSSSGPDIEYEWTGPGGFISSLITVEVTEPGVYILEVADTGQPNCTATDTVFVTEGETPPPIISISPNFISCDSAVLSYPLQPEMTITWTLPGGGTSTEPVLEVTESGNYLFTILDITNGCTASGQVSVMIDPGACATLKGRLVQDTLPDCMPAADEPGLGNWLVVMQGGGRVYYAVTQAGGYYEQRVPIGDYEVYPLIPGPLWLPCQDSYPVSLQQPGEMAMLDIPVQEQQPCPELSVNISMPLLRRCWARSLFINYCNDGTAPAEDAYIVVVLDGFFTFQSATAPLLSQDGNQYTFGIGDVAPGQCSSFIVQVQVSCDALVGQTLCAEAKIFPNAPCFPPSPNWSGASLQVKGACEGGEVQFRVENVGAGDMLQPRPCIVIEDGVMLLTAPGSIRLNSGEAFTYSFPANGATYRIEVEQEPFHPGRSMPIAVLEGCGTNAQGTFSTGFLNQLPLDDADPFIDIECREVIAALDPNDKHGFPRGYGGENFIYPGTGIEYLVQFQNTGNDTAFLVVIRDTLSPFLDITSVQPGAASHPYTWDIDSNNILVFTFEDILLPDSTTNLEGSQGFIEFKVAQQGSLPLGTVIENSAAIYFDINEPVITNTTFHTLGYGFIEFISFMPEAGIPELKVSAAPNPMGEWALLQLEGWQGGEGLFELFDLQGRRLRQQRFSGAAFRFKRQGLPAGLYAFRIVDERGRWGSGRLVVR